MNNLFRSCAGVAACFLLLSAPASAQDTVTIAGSGSGAFETPPIASAGVATASCTLNRLSSEIACTARVHNIVDLTAGHIHVGGPGAAGPTVMNIPSLPLRTSDDFTLAWTWTQSDLTLRPQQGVTKLLDVFEACSSGNCYINFHTTGNPGGEIRINMCPQGSAEGRAANPFFAINVCKPDR
ncbi:MAG: CHRD domain-containing protein [Acidobacteria bacterium]|nr:CHRD domain-containing protein [Acidobacteriota bacterium]